MWKIEKIVSKGDYDYAVVKSHPHAPCMDMFFIIVLSWKII